MYSSQTYSTSYAPDLQPGDVVLVAVGPVHHVGIVTDRLAHGEPFVISNSRRAGGVREGPLSVFSQGKPVFTQELSSSLPLEEVLFRARSRLGDAWDLIGWNCEHFVRHALGLPTKSPQLRVGLVACAVGLGLLLRHGRVRAT